MCASIMSQLSNVTQSSTKVPEQDDATGEQADTMPAFHAAVGPPRTSVAVPPSTVCLFSKDELAEIAESNAILLNIAKSLHVIADIKLKERAEVEAEQAEDEDSSEIEEHSVTCIVSKSKTWYMYSEGS